MLARGSMECVKTPIETILFIDFIELKGKKCQMDEDGKLKKEYDVYSLCTLMKAVSQDRSKSLNTHLPQISLRSGRGGNKVCLGDDEELFFEFPVGREKHKKKISQVCEKRH